MIFSEFAPAKINLFLSVIEKRPDNYHNIGSMFHTISVGDVIFGELDSTGSISLTYNNPQEYPQEKDLVFKAALKLKEKFENVSGQSCAGKQLGARLHLEKRLPLGAGLGGGSSDAAATLRLLNKLWNLNAANETLEKIGAELGADVPFLIKGGAAFAEGIGDILMPQMPIAPENSIILVATPKCYVPTSDAYGGIKPQGQDKWKEFKKSIAASETPANAGVSRFLFKTSSLFNHFEESVFPKFPEIKNLKQKLTDCGGKALMSGSGASVFAIFETLENAVKAKNAAKNDCRFLEFAKFF